jgi:hypothetical protein
MPVCQNPLFEMMFSTAISVNIRSNVFSKLGGSGHSLQSWKKEKNSDINFKPQLRHSVGMQKDDTNPC